MAPSEPWPHTFKVRFYRRTFKGYFRLFLSQFAFDAVKTQLNARSEVILELSDMRKHRRRRLAAEADRGLK
jgi:hypothetical protein